MNTEWFSASQADVVRTILSCVGVYLALIITVRINGLRTFSKMSSFDFAITVAIGSILATTVTNPTPMIDIGVLALVVLVALQFLNSKLRYRFGSYEATIDNCPLLLMDGPKFLHENMRSGRITVEDVKGKLREANVLDYSEIRAVVLEATGDMSVLHSSAPARKLDPDLLGGIRK